MKLLNRISWSYLLISLIIFLISGLIVFQLLNHIFRKQIDETLLVENALIEQTINYADSVPDFRMIFGHNIDITILNSTLKKAGKIHDTLMYNPETGEFNHFRHVFTQNTSIRKKGYTINLYKTLSESENLIAEILIAIAIVFLSLLVTLFIANYFIARRVWIPFYRILGKLGQYQIDQSTPLNLSPTGIHEFNLLREALEKMSRKISQDYQNLKEFNENAAHEVQTPLAIIKSKLDLLIQRENLDEGQLRLISNILDATQRISRLNQGLLLISKIDNNQFPELSQVELKSLLSNILESFEDLLSMKKITLTTAFHENCILKINQALVEIMFINLVSNAVKHNLPNGFIEINLYKNQLIIENSGTELKIDPKQLFERFKKSEYHPESVGLGLSIVRKISELYQIRISYTYADNIHTITLDFNDTLLQN